jgi:hypothetical protein
MKEVDSTVIWEKSTSLFSIKLSPHIFYERQTSGGEHYIYILGGVNGNKNLTNGQLKKYSS